MTSVFMCGKDLRRSPPQSVKDWWGEEEIDLEIFRMYETQNLDKPMMDKVRGKHARYKKNAINF